MNNVSSPRNDDDAIEQEIKAKGLTAPRVTPSMIEANIEAETYFTAAQGWNGEAASDDISRGLVYPNDGHLNLLTFCVLVLRNGFTVTGESACASPENFDAELGKKIARANAVNKVWPLMGYALKERLYAASQPFIRGEHGAAYTGTKTVLASGMNRGEYNAYRGWEAPEGEDQHVNGYLVEYTDGGKANDSRHVGYISWSPADVFEKAYRLA
jgi:hypothetical protein